MPPEADQRMQTRSSLSIVIPTFNRALFLDRCLASMSPLSARYGIRIFISDNASQDNTFEIVERWSAINPLISYHRNKENIGERNFEAALRIPQTRFVWLLGDTYVIPEDSLEYVLELIEKPNCALDAVVVNLNGRVPDVVTQTYTDRNLLLRQLGWHMTCLSCLVYSQQLIAEARFDRYRDTNFIQTGAIFEYIENLAFAVHWVREMSVGAVTVEGVTKESWRNVAFDIWVDRWVNFVMSLPPSYRLQEKLACIGSHGPKSGLFSYGGLANLRMDGFMDAGIILSKRRLLPLAIRKPFILVLLISVAPVWLLKMMRCLRHGRLFTP